MSKNQIADTPRNGLALLEDTLKSNTENTKALGRVLLAVKFGALTVNGQTPDVAYGIGEYFIHGGRVKFDLSALSAQEKQQFFTFITNNQAITRAFATHRAGGRDADGSPAEAKSGLLGLISDVFRALLGRSNHYGINLPVGGINTPCREGVAESIGKNIEENGEWGHMYLHWDDNLVMVGVESSAIGKHNERTGAKHSIVGLSDEESPFLEQKINSQALRDQQVAKRMTPLTTSEKYNWATVKISPQMLCEMLKDDESQKDN